MHELSIGAARRLFWTTFAATLLLKLVLAAGFPFTGDEAFFYQWGVSPAWGYSDHPPMVGWLLALLHRISDAPLVLRSVTLLVTSVIALGIVDVLMRQLPAEREAAAWLAGAVYLVLPWSWMFVLVTTDTPLLLFMALSAWCYLRANGSEDRSFNVFNRHEGAHWNLKTPLVYLGMTVYLLTPWLLWQGWRGRWADGLSPAWRSAATALWLFPILLFAFVSLRRSIGLHWVLGFVPLFVVWAGLRVDARALRTSFRASLALSLPHLLLVAAVAWTPLSWWQSLKVYDRLVFTRETPTLAAALKADLPAGATLMARTYNPAAMLAFPYGQYVPVFGVGRHHARQDDQVVDFRRYDGQPLRIFDYDEPDLADFQPFFAYVSKKKVVIEGVDFWMVDGTGFRYPPYRDTVLAKIAQDFHHIPHWLPLYGNPFCERYGFVECSPQGR